MPRATDATPTPSQPISGTVLAAEWDEGRTAVLVTVDAGGGARQLWLIPVGGVPQNVTPLGAAWIEAHFP